LSLAECKLACNEDKNKKSYPFERSEKGAFG
jgi:hypothetical protein